MELEVNGFWFREGRWEVVYAQVRDGAQEIRAS